MGSAKRTLWSKEIKNDLRIGEPVQFIKESTSSSVRINTIHGKYFFVKAIHLARSH